MGKRLFALILSAVLLVNAFPAAAIETSETTTEELFVTSEKTSSSEDAPLPNQAQLEEKVLAQFGNKSKLELQEAYSGTCGENLTWALNPDTGLLTISGEGTMYDYQLRNNAPWHPYCDMIFEVSFMGNVTMIGGAAFSDCKNLTTLTLPEGITSIGFGAFSYCEQLRSILLPKSLNECEYWGFKGCDSLEEINVTPGNPNFKSIDGILFSADGKTLLRYPPAKRGDSYEVPDTVEIIADEAMRDVQYIKELSISNSVKEIGWYAISVCDNLEEVYIGAGLIELDGSGIVLNNNLQNIYVSETNRGFCDEEGVLFSKDMKKIVHFPDGRYGHYSVPKGVTVIGESAFNATRLSSIWLPESVTRIEQDMLQGSNVKELVLPANVTYIGYLALRHSRLEKIYFCGDAPEIESSDISGQFTSMMTIYYIPGTSGWTDSSQYDAETEKWNDHNLRAWDGNINQFTKDISWSLVDGTLTISGKGAMSNEEYADVPWSNLQSLVKKVVIETGITTIGSNAFNNQTNLTEVILPSTIESIGEKAFYGCNSLNTIYLPAGLQSIGTSAFGRCGNLTNIEFPQELKIIEDRAFENCWSLADVRIPSNVISIGSNAFAYCFSLYRIDFMGDAPLVVPRLSSGDKDASFDGYVRLYYIEGTSGWTDSDAYDAETGTWNGYPLSTWVPTDLTITPLVEKEIEVNGSGKARMYFSLTDYIGNPVVGRAVTCSVQMREYHSVTDGNGVFSVQIPASTGKYPVQISVDGFEDILNGAIQTVSVTRKDLSYSQKWEASLGAELGASIGPSVSASVGVAEFEAAAAKAAANAGIGSTFSVENSYENGVRTLELTTQYDVSAGVEFKSGVEATAPSVTIKPVTLSAGASFMEQASAGLKIQNYDPHNMDHLIKTGSFYLQTALLGMHSVWAQRFLDLLDIKAHNQSAYTNKITLEAGASLGALESGGESITVAGADAKLSIAAEQSTDYLEKTRANALDLKTELGCGLLKVPSAAVSGYAIGLGGTNSLKAEVTYASDQTAQELSYTYYEAGEQDIAWLEAVEESKTKLSYKEEQLDKIAEAHPVLGSLLAQRRLIIPPIELIPALQSISMDDIVGEVEHIDVEKTGESFSIPFGIDLGIGASINLKGTFVEELSYTRSTGVVTSGTEYITSESDDHSAELWAQKQSPDELVTEPVRAAFDELASLFTDVRDYIVNGVKNGLATITGKVSKWFVNVTRIIAGETQSYTILTLQSEDEPDSNAAVAVTVGEPYQVAIYTDETQDTLVPDDELGDNSVILTMNYTPELLEEAGASADAVLQIYRFIPERNSYVLVPGCVLNKKEMKVMVKILHQGEYILATDSASPLISDFALSDQTPTPTLTVLASDMSGFKEFRFWIDDGEDLVTIDNMDAHYDAATGMFTYRFTEALAGGTHTAYFQAMDKLENANQEPFAFTFTIDAAPPEIATVIVPEGTATDALGFQVTAQVSDDAALSQVMLNATLPDGKTLHLTMEEQENGSFAATVAPLSGAGTVTLQVVAVDQAGNRTQSADYAVPISIPAEKTGLYLEAKRTGTALAVTVHNAQPKALGAWLVAAAYDTRGAMVDLQSSYVGLTGNASKTYDLSFVCGAEKIASATAFLVDVSNGYVPLAAERIS